MISKDGNEYLYSGTTGAIKIMGDGSLRMIEAAQVYDDLVSDAMAKRLFSTIGTVDYDYDENAITFQTGGDITDKNDRVAFNYQYPHKATVGSDAYFQIHFHWFQSTATTYEFTLEYRIQNNGEDKVSGWTSISASTTDDSVFTYTGGTINQITVFPELDVTGCDVSSTIQVRIARTDSNIGDCLVTFIDAHIGIDAGGSVTYWSKDGV